MKKATILYFTILLLGTNSQFLRFLQSSKNSYDYSSYSFTSINENLSGKTLSSTTSDQSVVYITQSGISISNSNLNKASGDSSKTENSEFYGVNAAVLVNGGGLTMTGGTVTTAAKGANAICATNNGKVTISGTTITSTGSGSARGLHATFGGKIEANKVNISTKGGSCATLATDRGEGTVTCTECTLSTAGAGSPLIYSTGDITVSKTTGVATGAQAVVIEGKNTATIKEASNLKCNGIPNRKTVDQCGVMLYQSMSGDAASGTSTFNCDKSTLEIQSSSSVYSSAPMFFITNTQAKINLEECTFKYGSGVFLKAEGTSEWGNSGSNGGVVTLTLTNQDIEGDIVVDSISSLTLNLIGSSIKGKINTANTAAKLAINLDSDSKITLTGNSYYTSLVNEKADGSNLVNGTYKWTYTEEKEVKTSSNQGNNNQGQGGQPPSGENGQGMPNGQPPSNMPNGQTPSGENGQGMPNGQPPSNMPNGQTPSGENGQGMPNGQPPSNMPNGQPPSGENGQGMPNGQPPSNMPNGQPPSGENGQGMPNGQPPSNMPNGQPPSGENGQGMPNGQPPSGSSNQEMPNGQPPSGSGNQAMPNGQPPSGSSNQGMPNGQNGEGIPNGQPPSDMPNGQNQNWPQAGNGNEIPNDGDEDFSEDEIGKYVRNSSSYLTNFIYMTLMTLAIIC
jgi:hypothetical protein